MVNDERVSEGGEGGCEGEVSAGEGEGKGSERGCE